MFKIKKTKNSDGFDVVHIEEVREDKTDHIITSLSISNLIGIESILKNIDNYSFNSHDLHILKECIKHLHVQSRKNT